MARFLNDISSLLRQITSDKITERKQAASKIHGLLRDPEVLDAIDQCSGSNQKSGSGSINWDVIVQRISKYAHLELKSNSENKIREAITYYQSAIQIAEKRGPKLKSSIIYSQLLDFLWSYEENFLVPAVCSTILKKYFLSRKCHLLELDVTKWHDLLEIFMKKLSSVVGSNEALQHASLLKELFKVAKSLAYVAADGAAKFFKEIFSKIKGDKHDILLQELLHTFYDYVEVVIHDWRYQIDELMNFLLPIFVAHFHSSVKNGSSLQYQMGKVFLLWINNNDQSTTVIENNQLKELLLKIYHIIQNGIEHMNAKIFYTRNKNNETNCKLAAQIICKVSKISIEEASQLYKSLCKLIVENPNTNSTISWLEILHNLFEERSGLLDFTSLLETIDSVLYQVKRGETCVKLLELLAHVIKNIQPNDNSITKRFFRNANDYSVKMIRQKKHSTVCFQLILTLWKAGYRSHSSHVYRLFTHENTFPTSASLELLLYLMKISYFPEQVDYDSLENERNFLQEKYPLRNQLLHWLLPYRNETANKVQFSNDLSSNYKICKILVSLLSVSPTKMVGGLKLKAVDSIVELFMGKMKGLYTEFISLPGKKTYSSKDIGFHLTYSCDLLSFLILIIINLDAIKDMSSVIDQLLHYCVLIAKKMFAWMFRITKSDAQSKLSKICQCLQLLEYVAQWKADVLPLILNQQMIEFLENLMTKKQSLVCNKSTTSPASKRKKLDDNFMDFDEDSPEGSNSQHSEEDWSGILFEEDNDEVKIVYLSFNVLVHFYMHGESMPGRNNFLSNLKELLKSNSYPSLILSSLIDIIERYSYNLMNDEILTVMSYLKIVFAKHHNNQEMCKIFLLKTSYLIDIIQNDRASSACEQARLVMVKILGVFCSLRTKKYCPEVRKTLVEVVAKIAKFPDDDGMWKLEIESESSKGNNLTSPSALVCQMMLDDSMAVRCAAVKNIKNLLIGKQYSAQLKVFSYLKSIFKKFHVSNVEATVSKDQTYNQSSMILLIAKEMLFYGIPFEKQTLWILVEFCQKKVLIEQQVEEMIDEVSSFHGYKDVISYLETKIDFLVKMFVEKHGNILEFPYKCFGFTDLVFCNFTFKIAVPYLLLYKKEDFIETLRQTLSLDEHDFLVACLPNIVLLTFPSHLSKLNNAELTDDKEALIRCLEKYQEMLGLENFNNELKKQFVDVFKLLFLHIFDEPGKSFVSSKYTRVNDVFSFYPPLSSQAVGDILTSITSGYSDQKAVHLVLVKKMENIAHLMSYFASFVNKSSTYLEKLNAMKIYYCFIVLLFKHFDTIKSTCGYYVVKELLHRLIFFIDEDNNEEVSNICFDLLGNIFKMVTQYSCIEEEVTTMLPFLTTKLTYYANSVKQLNGIKLLSFLVMSLTEYEELDDFRQAISQVYISADTSELKQIKEKVDFIKSMDAKTGQFDVWSILKNMQDFKLVNKQQLKSLVTILREKESYSKDEIKYLNSIKKILVQNAKSLAEVEKIQVIECLGLLMPVLADHEHVESRETLMLPEGCQHFVLIDELVDICFMQNINTCFIGLECLMKTLAIFTSSSIEALKQLKSFQCIASFLTPRKKKSTMDSQLACSMDNIQDKLLESRSFLHNSLSFNAWMTHLVSIFLQEKTLLLPFFSNLNDICQVNSEFSRKCFPYIIECMLSVHGDFKPFITTVIDQWMSLTLQHFQEHQQNKETIEKVSVIVSLIQHLHMRGNSFGSGKRKTCWDSQFHLDLNYMNLAKLSQLCSQYCLAALFLEFHMDKKIDTHDSSSVSHTEHRSCSTSKYSQASTYNENESLIASGKGDDDWKKLAFSVYESIQEKDVMYGLDTSFLSFEEKRLQSYNLEKDFAKSLSTNDMLSKVGDKQRLFNDLVDSGLLNTAFLCSRGLNDAEVEKFSELQFESAWKNGIWDDAMLSGIVSCGYHGNIHSCLSAIQNNDEDLVQSNINDLKTKLLNIEKGLENKNVGFSQFSQRCFTINQLESTVNFIFRDEPRKSIARIEMKFDDVAESMDTTTQALKIACQILPQRQNIKAELFHHLIQYNILAVSSKRYHVCERIMHELYQLQSDNMIDDASWKIDEAKLYWVKNEKKHAIFRLKGLLDQMERGFEDDMDIYPVALGLYGHWMGETKSKNPVAIMENYLEPAIDIMESDSYNGKHSPVEAYHSLAKYADEQYQNILDYIKSPAFDNRQAVIKKNKLDIMKNEQSSNKSKEKTVQRFYMNLKKHCEEDETDLEQLVQNKRNFLMKAIKYYCKCLEMKKEKYEMKILRLCSLWFTNYSDQQIAIEVKESFERISSDNFLLVMYQLAARLGTNMANTCYWFNDILENVIVRCVSEHPHHSLFILLALCNANIDKVQQQPRGRNKLANTNTANNQVRVRAAKKVLDSVRKKIPSVVKSAEQLAVSYVELAYWDVKDLKKEKGPFNIPESKMLTKINNMKALAVPTMEIPVQRHYDDIVHVVKFDHSFSLAGGINLPKIITCVGSDGIRRKQLVKGSDDLRQDAVMQQVFGVVNQLFNKDSESRLSNLNMRTYKVVPLSQKSGVLQWCEGTMPIGNYLVHGQGNTLGAHVRYYPKDWSTRECREKLSAASGEKGSQSKLSVYQRIEKNFHPVFRYFFLEKFKDASLWMNRRLKYIRSCAVASMVGYIVGLGDRHCQNILIDCNTAELIHIDLGVAFEQGKLLPTPETIPFRLTRDIVDGMGVLGIEGVYRRCCERSLSVLKNSKEALITIVEVLLYDPLSQWNISLEKARNLQREVSKTDTEAFQITLPTQVDEAQKEKEESDKNMAAERVLIRLEQKLTGYEDHTHLACEGQVSYLIQEARSKRNLCKLFGGWQPWV